MHSAAWIFAVIWQVLVLHSTTAARYAAYGANPLKRADGNALMTSNSIFQKAPVTTSDGCDADEACVFTWACERIRKPVRPCSGPFYFFTVCCKTGSNAVDSSSSINATNTPPNSGFQISSTLPQSTTLARPSLPPVTAPAPVTPNLTPVAIVATVPARRVCGKAPLMNRMARIVGGTAAQFGEFPFQAMVVIKGAEKCGGALLNNDWVVTAGHCVAPATLTAQDFVVKLGVWDRTRTNDILPVEERLVTRIILHPTYSSMRSFSQDVALLKLSTPVVYAPHIQPICLPAPEDDFTYLAGTITGWGRLQFREDRPNVLQKADVPIIPNWQCENMFSLQKTQEKILPDMMCAVTADGSKDACQGDSGGPLSVIQGGSHVLAGLVSWGYGCALPGYPGVYARISKFVGWLDDTMKAN